MKKLLLLYLIIGMSLFSSSAFVKAETKDDWQKYNEYYFGEIVDFGSVEIDGKINDLYKVFNNRETALESFKNANSLLINCIKSNYVLPELTCSNYEDYRKAFYDLIDSKTCPEWLYDQCEEMRMFEKFFDIFENNEWNEAIIQIVNNGYETVEERMELVGLLPCTDPFVKEYQNSSNTRSISGFTISDGVSYAGTYAYSYNSYYHHYSSGDCANFASQILEAGGKTQWNTGNQSTGWWYNHSSVSHYLDTCSNSWRLANSFANYFGMDYSTTNHSGFSSSIRKGSFIAFDAAGDGNWDHIGFVTDRSSSYNSSLGYYNYRVAQHSNDYNAWTSSSENGWETLEDGTCIYGVVSY